MQNNQFCGKWKLIEETQKKQSKNRDKKKMGSKVLFLFWFARADETPIGAHT